MLITDEITLWILGIAVLSEVVAIATLAWTVHVDRVRLKNLEEQRERDDVMFRLERWNDRVYKRWLDVFVVQTDEGISEFRVPNPPGETDDGEGLLLTEIPEFDLARGYIEEQHPDVIDLWTETEGVLSEVDDARRQHRAAVTKVINRQMKYLSPGLHGKKSRKPLEANSFHWDIIADRVQDPSLSWAHTKREPTFSVKVDAADLDDGRKVLVLKDAQIHVVGEEKTIPDREEYERMLGLCSKDEDATEMALVQINRQGRLNLSLSKFLKALEKITVNIDSRLEDPTSQEDS